MNGTSTNETEIISRLNKEQAIIMIRTTILVIVTMLVGVVGNSLTCYVYGFRLKMTPTYFFVVMLAIVDLISCLILNPGRIVQNVAPLMVTSDGLCKNQMVLSVFNGICTGGFLVAIAVDRYRKLCCPLKTQISMKVAKIITLSIFLFCAIQGGLATLYYGSVRKPTAYPNVFGHSCSAKITKEVNYYQLGFFDFYLILVIFVTITLVVLYSIVLHTMKKIVNKHTKLAPPPPSKAENLGQRLSKVVIQLKLEADPSSTRCDNSTTMTTCASTNTLEEIIVSEEISSSLNSVQQSPSSGTSPSDNECPQSRKELAQQETRTRSLKRAEDNIKRLKCTTVTMIMITAVFVVTSITAISAMMVNAVMKVEQTMGTVAAIFYWLIAHTICISPSINPIIYGYRNPKFMDEVWQLFGKVRS